MDDRIERIFLFHLCSQRLKAYTQTHLQSGAYIHTLTDIKYFMKIIIKICFPLLCVHWYEDI